MAVKKRRVSFKVRLITIAVMAVVIALPYKDAIVREVGHYLNRALNTFIHTGDVPVSVTRVASMPPARVMPDQPAREKPAEIPLPLERPRIAEAPKGEDVPLPKPRPVVEAALPPAAAPVLAYASLTLPELKMPMPKLELHTAVYDITSHTVYMPDGTRLEAHSGFGAGRDNPAEVKVKDRGPTPPNIYDLVLREHIFHGVEAIRLIPVDKSRMYGRDGILAHTYMLDPKGASNGCVSFKNYDAFKNAYLNGKITRLVVVSHIPARLTPAMIAHEGDLLPQVERPSPEVLLHHVRSEVTDIERPHEAPTLVSLILDRMGMKNY